MSYFELVVLKFQKTFSGQVVEDYPGKGTKEKDVVVERVPEGSKPVNSPPEGGKSLPVKKEKKVLYITVIENYNLFYGDN